MRSRYPKKDRELAAMIPALCASNEFGYSVARQELDVHWTSAAGLLADAAWDRVYWATDGACRPSEELFAEAEALIRTGWSP